MPPLRVAIGVGKGNTDWQYLTSNDDTLALSVPNSAKDRGTAYRIESEFQFTPHVAAGINMQQFADSTIHFPYGNMYHHGTMDCRVLPHAAPPRCRKENAGRATTSDGEIMCASGW